MCLLDGIDRITLRFQVPHRVQRLFIIRPLDGFFGAEGGFMDLLIRWAATDTAKDDSLDTHSVCRAEYGAHIMLAAHVIEHNY